jgi:acyl-CoA dehydrogenase
MWQDIAASGFLDALVAEEHGGAGLTLAQIEPLVEALGARAVPLPVAETMVARALLAQHGISAPEGPITLAPTLAQPVPFARVAHHALVDTGTALVLCAMADLSPEPTGVVHALSARLSGTPAGPALPRPAAGLRAIAAVLRAALIAGAAARLCEMASAYASERVQFGKPIGRQQALQQMLAVMAEDMVACRIAAQLGMAQGLDVSLPVAATAKITTSSSAPRIAASAHAVHGAIGISEEHDLQLLTRRLHEWRLADGSEGYWSKLLGEARLGGTAQTVDWVRKAIFA